jgi:hypothetical protein
MLTTYFVNVTSPVSCGIVLGMYSKLIGTRLHLGSFYDYHTRWLANIDMYFRLRVVLNLGSLDCV